LKKETKENEALKELLEKKAIRETLESPQTLRPK